MMKEIGGTILGVCVAVFLLCSVVGWTGVAVAAGFVAIFAGVPLWTAGYVTGRKKQNQHA